jgi:hypothetical protein
VGIASSTCNDVVDSDSSSDEVDGAEKTGPPIPSSPSTQRWFEGGNLHNANMGEWRIATNQNKLATAADWLTVLTWKGHVTTSGDFDRLKVKAQMLANAVDGAVSADSGLDSMKAKEVAASIIILANDLGP